MTNEQILKKIIKKAVAGGWKNQYWSKSDMDKPGYLIGNGRHFIIIFSHDFAKSYWGDHIRNRVPGVGLREWQYHLQEMVLQKEPIKYMEGFL